ncbi:MAG: hypothetical protein QXO76_07735 [Thermoproteota archaeon]
MNAKFNLIQKIYIALCGRPAGPVEVKKWTELLPENPNLDDSAVIDVINQIIETLAEEIPWITQMTSYTLESIYNNAFHRLPTNSEKQTFITKTTLDVIMNILKINQGKDYETLTNKVTYAEIFCEIIDPNKNGLPDDSPDGKHFMATFENGLDYRNIASKLQFVDADNPPVAENVREDVLLIANPEDAILNGNDNDNNNGNNNDNTEDWNVNVITTIKGTNTHDRIYYAGSNVAILTGSGSDTITMLIQGGEGLIDGGEDIDEIYLIGSDITRAVINMGSGSDLVHIDVNNGRIKIIDPDGSPEDSNNSTTSIYGQNLYVHVETNSDSDLIHIGGINIRGVINPGKDHDCVEISSEEGVKVTIDLKDGGNDIIKLCNFPNRDLGFRVRNFSTSGDDADSIHFTPNLLSTPSGALNTSIAEITPHTSLLAFPDHVFFEVKGTNLTPSQLTNAEAVASAFTGEVTSSIRSVLVFNDGTNSYLWYFSGDENGNFRIDSSELKLIGVIEGVSDLVDGNLHTWSAKVF